MNGIDYLLDTNFVLGLLKSDAETLAVIDGRHIESHQCAYSAITRMELLDFPGITPGEESLILGKLTYLTYLPISALIENIVIHLRRTHKVKLPDAIIAATALAANAELLTFDRQLQAVLAAEIAARPTKPE